MRQHINICRKPGNRKKRNRIQPASLSMLPQLELTTADAAPVALHTQVKGGIIPLHRVRPVSHLHQESQFLLNLTGDSLARCLPRFNLATGKLPSAAVLMLRAFHRKHLPLIIQNEGSHNIDPPEFFA